MPGASINFINAKIVDELRLPVESITPRELRLANGKSEQITKRVNVSMKIESWRDQLTLMVADIKFDAVVGLPWIQQNGVKIERTPEKIMVTCNDVSTEKNLQCPIETISAKQVEKELRAGEELFAVLLNDVSISDVAPQSAIDGRVKNVLADYADVFPDGLSPGLPPSRPIEHHVDLEPGAVPPKQATYRMSYNELTEVKKQLNT